MNGSLLEVQTPRLTINMQTHPRTDGQSGLARYMPIGKAQENGYARILCEPTPHRLEPIAPISWAEPIIGKAAQQNSLLLAQNTGHMQLGEHTLNTIRVLRHIF